MKERQNCVPINGTCNKRHFTIIFLFTETSTPTTRKQTKSFLFPQNEKKKKTEFEISDQFALQSSPFPLRCNLQYLSRLQIASGFQSCKDIPLARDGRWVVGELKGRRGVGWGVGVRERDGRKSGLCFSNSSCSSFVLINTTYIIIITINIVIIIITIVIIITTFAPSGRYIIIMILFSSSFNLRNSHYFSPTLLSFILVIRRCFSIISPNYCTF